MDFFATARDPAGSHPGSRPSAHHGGKEAGFSLPELLVVLVVVGILSALLIPNIDIMKYKMDGSARGLMMGLVMAQRTAVKRQHDVVIAFDTANQRMRVHEDEDNDGAIDTGERVRHIMLDEDVRFGLGSATARTTASPNPVNFSDEQGELPAVRFHRSGSASSQGSFYLTSVRATRATNYARDTRAVEVDRATGRVTWYYFDPPAWESGA